MNIMETICQMKLYRGRRKKKRKADGIGKKVCGWAEFDDAIG